MRELRDKIKEHRVRSAVVRGVALLAVVLAPRIVTASESGIRLAPNRAASLALLERADTEGVYFTDIAGDKGGTAYRAQSQPLPVGRYRLHVQLAMMPLRHILSKTIGVVVRVAGTERALTEAYFATPDGFREVTVDFMLQRPQQVAASVSWEFGRGVKKEVLNERIAFLTKNDYGGFGAPVIGAPVIGALDFGDTTGFEGDDLGLTLDEPAREGDQIPLAQAQKDYPYHLLARGIHLETLAPVLLAVSTDKITYRPGERAQVSLTARNIGTTRLSVELGVQARYGLDGGHTLHQATLVIPAGETFTWTGELATDDLYWGVGVEAVLTCKAYAPVEATEVFAVRKNIWETAIVTSANNLGAGQNPDMTETEAAAAVAVQRALGFTAFEAFFWAPDDLLDYTPETERFFGCQGAYPATISGLRNLIQACHDVGMAATMYANLWGAGGLNGIEQMRQHPDWFGPYSGNTYTIDDAPLLTSGKMRPNGIWFYNQVHFQQIDKVHRLHAEEIIASHKMFGWDATRYDSYYSSGETKRATALTRKIVEAAIPEYQFGYNSLATGDWKAKATEIMFSGGGLLMEEAAGRDPGPNGKSEQFIHKLIMCREVASAHGGHLGVVRGSKEQDAQNYAATCALLAAGAHPYYGVMYSGRVNMPRFALRYSEFLWDNRLHMLKAPWTWMPLTKPEPPAVSWYWLARSGTLSNGRQRFLLHLIPKGESVGPYDDLLIRVPADARITGAWLISPELTPQHRRMDVVHNPDEDTVTFGIPKLHAYGIVVIDYNAAEPIPNTRAPKDLEAWLRKTYLK